MSSELNDDIDSIVQKLKSNDKSTKKSPQIKENPLNSQNDNSSKSNKRLRKNGHHEHNDLSSNNNIEKSSKPKEGSANMKELSFFPEEEEDVSEKGSSPLDFKVSKEESAKNHETVKAVELDEDNDVESNDVNNKSTEENSDDIEVNETLELDLQEDASSTSSCSCEDHSSVAGRSENHHEDLDYDEDSISDSLPGTSNTTQEPTYPSSSSPTSSKQIFHQRSSALGSDPLISKLDNTHKISINKDTEKSGHEKINFFNQNHSRIKSVINFNHDNDCESIKSRDNGRTSNDKSHKSYECLLKYFFKDACYFQIKSINHENVELSKSLGVWSTPIQNEVRLNTAFREHRNVILIFSVQQSGGFQGFARMVSESKPTSRVVPWVLPERMSKKSLGGIMKVEWLCTKELPFHETHSLYNSFNDNKPVKIARDGQQVEPKVGKKLCKLFPRDSKEKLLSSLTTLKRQTSQRKKSSRYDNFYPLADRRSYGEEGYRQNYFHHQGANGIGEPSIPTPFSHDHNPYNSYGKSHRPLGRRRTLNHASHGIYHRQDLHPIQYGLPRSNHMPRNFDVMPGSMPGAHDNFHQSFGYTPTHHYSNPYDTWPPNPDLARYHPYQRSRR